MPILLAIGIALLLLVVYGPSFWAKRTLAKHSDDRPDLPGTGGELARHLLDEAGLREVRVETVPPGITMIRTPARCASVRPITTAAR